MKTEHSIAQLCAALDVTRSGYHAWVKAAPSARAVADTALRADLRALHAAHRQRYGARRHRQVLRQRGQRHSTKRIARLMRAEGLRGRRGRQRVPRTTDSAHDQPVAANRLAVAPAPTGPNQVWVSDLTYVATGEGWLFVAVLLDRWSRRVIGWACGATLATLTVLAALTMALRQRQPPRGLLHHSDRGVQYASAEYRAALAAAGLVASMSRKGNPDDNAAMESFMGSYKRECVVLAEEAGG